MTTIAVFVGSIRRDSLNKKLAEAIEAVAPQGVEFRYVDIGSLPQFNEELEANFPASARGMKDIVEAADGILFVTPEYNRGMPGVLKNAIDWASRPDGANSFVDKPSAVVGVSTGRFGTITAQTQLKLTLLYLGTKLIGQPEVYIPNGRDVFNETVPLDDRTRKLIVKFMETFVTHVESNK